MPTRAQIIEAMQLDFVYPYDPLNTTSSSRYTITYDFFNSNPNNSLHIWHSYTNYRSWTAAEMGLVRAALDQIETFLNVDFVEVDDPSFDSTIAFGVAELDSLSSNTSGVSSTYVLGSGSTVTYWDAYGVYDVDWFTIDGSQDVTSRTQLILHEIGHALGLDHPFDDDGNPKFDSKYENNHYSTMSYTPDPKSYRDPDGYGYNDVMMLFDVLALQDIWGTASYLDGDTTYTGPRTDNVDVIWDTGGIDILDATARSNNVTLDLREGRFSTFGSYEDVAIAYDTNIERAFGGSGDDKILGNALKNVLKGFDGADKIKGFAKGDRIVGGTGDDKLIGGGGHDKLFGGPGDDILRGGLGNDKLRGGPGADVFIFKGNSKRDTILDFEDDIDTLRIVGYGNLSQVLAHATQVGDDVQFDFGDDSVLHVHNMTISDLSNDLDLR